MKMRILSITFGLLFFVVATSAQEWSKMYDAKVVEADSLKKQINSLVKEKNETIDSLKNEITKQNEFKKEQDKFKKEQEKFEKEQKTGQDKLKTEQDKLKTDMKEFEKKQEENRKLLIQKSDSIVALKESLIKSKQEQERLSSEKLAEGLKSGKEEVISVISQYYIKQSSFDQLVKSTTTGSITQDRELLRRFDNQNEALKIMQNILIYKEAEQLLHSKYDAVKVKEYSVKLDSIGDSKSIQDLRKLLEYFELCNAQLIDMLKTIQKAEPSDGNELIKNKIENDMWNMIGRCLFDYDIENYYPYLRRIVFELIYLKQKDAEADVSELLKKL